MENLTQFKDFKNKKQGAKLNNTINEGVIKIGNEFILSDIALPVSLVNSYIKKVKDSTGKNVREMLSDQDVAARVLKYVVENFAQIDNLPESIILGEPENAEEVQVQQTQGQPAQTQTPTQEI